MNWIKLNHTKPKPDLTTDLVAWHKKGHALLWRQILFVLALTFIFKKCLEKNLTKIKKNKMIPWSREEMLIEADPEMTQRTERHFKIAMIKMFKNLV